MRRKEEGQRERDSGRSMSPLRNYLLRNYVLFSPTQPPPTQFPAFHIPHDPRPTYMKRFSIGIDIGGTKIAGILLNKWTGAWVFSEILTRHAWSPRDLRDIVHSMVEEVAVKGGADFRQIGSIGVGVPGVVDERGRIKKVPNLPALERVDVLRLFPGIKLTVWNDAACAAFAEAKLGHQRASVLGVHLTLGTGLGGAVLERERRRFPMRDILQVQKIEIGHIGANMAAAAEEHPDEPYELEAFCSRAFFRRSSAKHVQTLYEDAKRDRNSDASSTFLRFGAHVGSLLATVDTLFQPETITLGGGLMAYYYAFRPSMMRVYRRRKFLPGQPARIRPSAFGPEGGALGAALYGSIAAG